MPETLKPNEIEANLLSRLKEALGRPNFVLVKDRETHSTIKGAGERTFPSDAVFSISINDRPYMIVAEAKTSGQPKVARQAILQLKQSMGQLPGGIPRYGVFLAPYISPDTAQLCVEAGIGFVDLAGNSHLAFEDVFMESRVQENPYKEERRNRPLFSPKSERVLRVLLTPPLRPWKVVELSQASGVSLGQVSTVRGHLLEREWARTDKNGIAITRPEELAAAWKKAYKPMLVSGERRYTVLHGAALDTAIREASADQAMHPQVLLASFSAAKWIAPFVRQATTYFYATESGFRALEDSLQLKSAALGENVVIGIPREDDVFTSGVEPTPGIWCTDLIQTWLDLGALGDRGMEAADHLMQRRLLPAWRASVG